MSTAPHPDTPRIVTDPSTGRPILMAPLRQLRPMHTGAAADQRPCPFCPGHEHETPPTLDAERDADHAWIARSFANKYPAAVLHEVIADGAAHHEHPAALDATTWRRCIELWRRRILAIEAQDGIVSAFFFKNVGAMAGASIAHNHSQVIGLPMLPPRLELERQVARTSASCPWCAELASAEADRRLVCRTAQHAVIAPANPKLPNETWLLPTACCDDFATTDLDSLAAAVDALFRAVDGAFRRPALNFWLHRIRGERFHWHFELQPRTGQLAGLELGGDMYINSMPPQASVQRLRAALP
jgi:UDPglucose--hexose-1-phosphate uridylyltransferase